MIYSIRAGGRRVSCAEYSAHTFFLVCRIQETNKISNVADTRKSSRIDRSTVFAFSLSLSFLFSSLLFSSLVFSALRRLKNYLPTTMLRDIMNNIAIFHIYLDMVDKLDVEKSLDKFIT